MSLTAKQQAFVEAYAGNATDAARKAGYKGADGTLRQVGHENMTNPDILAAIKERGRQPQIERIMAREELQAFWSEVVRDKDEGMQNRLHAGDSLAKSHGMFLTKVEHTGKLSLESLINEAMKPKEPTT